MQKLNDNIDPNTDTEKQSVVDAKGEPKTSKKNMMTQHNTEAETNGSINGNKTGKKTRKERKAARREENKQKCGNPPNPHSGNKPYSTPRCMLFDDPKEKKRLALKLQKQQVPMRTETIPKPTLFSHLVQIERSVCMSDEIRLCGSSIHPSFVNFGLKCADGTIFTSRARSIRLIQCLKDFIRDYNTPISKEFARDFETKLSPSLSFLSECRPNSSGMATIIKFLKLKFSEAVNLSEIEMKKTLTNFLEQFLEERIFMAGYYISTLINQKIVKGETILTFSTSQLIARGLIDAHKENKNIKVIVVDTVPRHDGLRVVEVLVKHGIRCSYIGLNGLSVVMKYVSKVILGAEALLSNGAVLSPVGSAMIALVADFYHVPVLICCETFSFSERAQIDAIVYNELGDPRDILVRSKTKFPTNWKDKTNVSTLNLYYDVIQPRFVAAVVTEIGIIPCTSAPVVLRIKN